MAYQSVHSGPAIDAAVTQLADIQIVRDESNANLAAVQNLAAQVATDAGTASTAAASATQTLNDATAAIAAADHTRQEQIDAEIAIVADQRFAAEQAATEAVAAADAAVVTVTQDMAASVPTPNKLPLADAQGKIASDWLGADIARAADVVRGDALAAPAGAGLVGFQQSGAGAVARTMQDKARDVVSVKDFGAVGDGVADDTAAIQAAIDSGKPYSTSTTGRLVFFPPGRYKVTTIDISGCHGIQLIGSGPSATEVFAAGTLQVFKAVGSSAAPLNKASIKSMTIRGGGEASVSAHGIDIQWGNHCYLHDLVLFSCRHAINLAHQWQTSLRDISVHGAGGDRSYIGVYMGATTLSYIDNAVQAVNIFVQAVSGYGFRIINGQGSKFTNCEAGGSPMIHAWYVGDPPAGTVKCQWMHFSNCLGDSTSSAAWLFRQGAASELSQIQLSNCWAGNGDFGFFFDGAQYVTAGQLYASGNTKSGINLVNSQHNIISGAQLVGNNEEASATIGDIQLSGGSWNSIVGNLSSMANSAGKSLIESGGTNDNTITGNIFLQGATIAGANTIIYRNRGFRTENSGSAQIGAAATSATVSHGLGVTPTVDRVRVTPRDNMGSATKFWVSAATAESFTISVNAAPGSTITFGWAVDLVRV